MDTEDLAREARENQGPWEAEYSYQEEADLGQLYDKCDKNPGHKNFIPVHEFCMQDLPEGFQDSNVLDYIRTVSELTVRVSARYVSDRRPDTFPGTRKRYPGHQVRGQKRVTLGTGWVDRVDLPTHGIDACQCKSCLASLHAEKLFARISIQTASHVIYDSKEGEHTTCHLYFDQGPRPEKCPGAVALAGMSVKDGRINRDMCELLHYTHDLALARRLQQQLDLKTTLLEKIYQKFPQLCRIKRNPGAQDKQPPVFIVSHPHGCSKHISIGRCSSVDVFSDDNFQFLYDTATCHGSSGGPVCMLHRHSMQFLYARKGSSGFMEIHCGNAPTNKRLNYCNVIRGWPSLNMVTLETLQLDDEPWEGRFTCVDEADLQAHYTACQRNPGHPNVFPVETLGLDHLPPLYRKDEVLKYIRIVSDLTVRVTVKCVSEKRPETVPGTDIAYPWYSDRRSSRMRVGTGLVSEVDIFKNDSFYKSCDCKQCLNSPAPRTEFAHIYVDTALHLVFDDVEAEYTSCLLCFDSGETPDLCSGTVTLTGTSVASRDPDRDWCRLTHVTHDLDLAERVDTMMNTHNECLETMKEYEYFEPMEDGKQNGRQYARGEVPLHIVVSYPHGYAKRISLGYHGNPGNTSRGKGQYEYTSTICPGSSGGPAVILGWETFFPYVE
ncbi:hypothetical protein BsWGS_22120 [Bradybaena similaris]